MKLPLEENENSTNLTPLIDVVFLLLIFFLVATRFDQEEKEISIRVPDVYKARPVSAGPQEVIVNITADGEYIVTGETLTEPQVRGLISGLTKNNPADLSAVQIRTDMDAQVKFAMAVVGMCEDQKIKHSFSVLEKRQP
ncbi:MAG TPA: biopolymer transporter ExbD [Planctomycetaceae bacterium]|nr:biopolymer transporter ExbD [Blastopirellula sp.]HAY82963.1 biopolymer transporter ExbD [Planctomycetaceae bacterium]|tara:strand:- start:758 stop:1174 length:417 start_codon:yes stop_codon:yes gene_type:complete